VSKKTPAYNTEHSLIREVNMEWEKEAQDFFDENVIGGPHQLDMNNDLLLGERETLLSV